MARPLTDEDTPLSIRQQLVAIRRVAGYHPAFTLGIIGLSTIAALLEGVGLSFILPIVELAQGELDPTQTTGILAIFVGLYDALGLPFTLGYLVLGLVTIISARFTTSFLVGWLGVAIETYYVRHLQRTAFDRALEAEVAYFDQEGSDDILNAIVTQAEHAGRTIRYLINSLEMLLLVGIYLAIAVYLAPLLSIAAVVALGTIVVFFRVVLETGYSIGDRVADANESIQRSAQAGTQGIREVKSYGLSDELRDQFNEAVDRFTTSVIVLGRNETAINKFYNLAAAVTVFALIYVGIVHLSISLGALGLFLFAMFRLGPTLSGLNSQLYRLEGTLPHLVRTQAFIDELAERSEDSGEGKPVDGPIESVTFDSVTFAYGDDDEPVLDDISFRIDRGEFVAFVGPSGAGKSTIASLISRMYQPSDGEITANGIPIDVYDLAGWRSRIATVQQHPHIFNDTLYRNVSLGDRDASRAKVEWACEVAHIPEFLPELENGYETILGDDGVRLSGGQRQRVSLARALLKDADILVLDEATSDLDSRLEDNIQRAIDRLESDQMTLAIAHRLSTVQTADRIYTLVGGRITEMGRHEELVTGGGTYAELYELQSGTAEL